MNQSETGFTLIEVLIAIVVLATGILALYTMQFQSIRGNDTASALTQSTNSARARIEELLGRPFTHSDLNPGTHSVTGNNAPVVSMTWTVSAWDSDGQDNDLDGRTDEFDERGVKQVSMVVRYRDKGIVKQISTQFIRSEIF